MAVGVRDGGAADGAAPQQHEGGDTDIAAQLQDLEAVADSVLCRVREAAGALRAALAQDGRGDHEAASPQRRSPRANRSGRRRDSVRGSPSRGGAVPESVAALRARRTLVRDDEPPAAPDGDAGEGPALGAAALKRLLGEPWSGVYAGQDLVGSDAVEPIRCPHRDSDAAAVLRGITAVTSEAADARAAGLAALQALVVDAQERARSERRARGAARRAAEPPPPPRRSDGPPRGGGGPAGPPAPGAAPALPPQPQPQQQGGGAAAAAGAAEQPSVLSPAAILQLGAAADGQALPNDAWDDL